MRCNHTSTIDLLMHMSFEQVKCFTQPSQDTTTVSKPPVVSQPSQAEEKLVTEEMHGTEQVSNNLVRIVSIFRGSSLQKLVPNFHKGNCRTTLPNVLASSGLFLSSLKIWQALVRTDERCPSWQVVCKKSAGSTMEQPSLIPVLHPRATSTLPKREVCPIC